MSDFDVTRVTVGLEEPLYVRLLGLAERNDRSLAAEIRVAVRERLEREERDGSSHVQP